MELLARGMSVRDIEYVFKDETGRLLLSRTALASHSTPAQSRRLQIVSRNGSPKLLNSFGIISANSERSLFSLIAYIPTVARGSSYR